MFMVLARWRLLRWVEAYLDLTLNHINSMS